MEWAFVKNDNYWDAENVYLDEAHISVIKEIGTGIDILHTLPKAKFGYLGFNTARENTGNIALRRAISQAFDKELYN